MQPERTRKRRKKENSAEREWAKYEKARATERPPPIAAAEKPRTTKRKSKKERRGEAPEAPLVVDADGMLFLEDDALAKAKEPSDRMRIERDELDPLALEQRAQSTHAMPSRTQQSVRTLALREGHAYHNDIALDMQRHHWYRNAEQRALPMQRVLEEFMPIDNLDPEATLLALTRDLQTESQYMSHVKQQQAQTQAPEAKRDQPIAKMNMINGVSLHSLNYNRRTPKDVEERLSRSAQSERMARFYAFYAHDRIDASVDFGALPRDLPMFAQLQQQYGRKYQAHEALMQDCAALVPKADVEVVSREWIRKYRQRPEEGAELCSQGAACIFSTFSSDKHVGYVGPVFYTPQERKGQVAFRNHDRLCVDCLWYLWTKTHDRNVANEAVCDRPMNHFAVECRAGQYSPLLMLTVMENDRPTGISKHVPRFSCNNRQFVALAQLHHDGDKLHKIYTPYLAEVGMDF